MKDKFKVVDIFMDGFNNGFVVGVVAGVCAETVCLVLAERRRRKRLKERFVIINLNKEESE